MHIHVHTVDDEPTVLIHGDELAPDVTPVTSGTVPDVTRVTSGTAVFSAFKKYANAIAQKFIF